MFSPCCWHRAGHDSSLQTLGQIKRFELSDYGWSVITVALRNTPRGTPRDRDAVSTASFGSCIQTLVGEICLRSTVPALLATNASLVGGGLVSGIISWTRWPPVMMQAVQMIDASAVRKHHQACHRPPHRACDKSPRSFSKARTQPHTSNCASISESAVFGVSCAGNWARWSLNKTPRLNPSSATTAA